MRRDELESLFSRLYPDGQLHRIRVFGVDDADEEGGATTKGIGYGAPVRLQGEQQGRRIDLVLHTATADPFGHDRRSDRAAEMLLAFDTFGQIPGHAPAVDVGTVVRDRFVSLKDSGEFYLLTEYRPGSVYADTLRQMAHRGHASDVDEKRAHALIHYLATLHATPTGTPLQYRRAIRDLVGSGEGIFGIGDGYPESSPPALIGQVRRIEEACVAWRWRLVDSSRCRRTHGDFHPFNLLFTEDNELSVLDAARGCVGDPADDLSCLAVNFPFFALANPSSWRGGFRKLWRTAWEMYGAETGDHDINAAAPPFLAWRLLVLANPAWYPDLPTECRQQLLSMAETALAQGKVTLDLPEAMF